jgi:16S rRNA (adenine1518-N6/adenine1519-N6)-dimethyltransferase
VASKRYPLFFDSRTGQYPVAPSLNLPFLNVPGLLRDYHLSPKKGLGQNFLVDPETLRKIIQVADIPPGALVLEVGPGLGSLTRGLAQVARKVVAVELDSGLLPLLERELAGYQNVEVVQGDILEIDPPQLMGAAGYLVVANIPYYITSALIRHLLSPEIKPVRIVLTVQKEVADRICATPGDLSLLALSVQVYGEAKKVLRISAGAFYPVPKVDSCVVRVDLYPQPVIAIEQLDVFFKLARAGFTQKRKTLRNSLSAGLHQSLDCVSKLLLSVEIDPRRRAETLNLSEWKELTEAFVSLQR